MSQRYFEDVQVDEDLPPVEKMPTEDLAIEFFGRDNPMNPAFADAEAGRRMGVGGALVPGNLKLAWLVQFVSDWAGTEGRVLGLRAVFRRPDIANRPITLAGRVVDKREDGGLPIVELEVVTLAEGEPSVRGNMQVALPLRGAGA